MRVRKINIVPKMTIHVTNMFRICADTVRIIYIENECGNDTWHKKTLLYIYTID